MENPRPEKVAVVDEVRARLGASQAAILTEYRGLTVAQLAELRQALSPVGAQYAVYKNTLVKRAVAGSRHEPLKDLLTGPTAIAFVSGDLSGVAKALRDFARANPHLLVKGGMLGDGVLSSADLATLADLPSRDVLLARLAGALAAPMQQLASLLQALPRNLACGLSALVDKRREEGSANEVQPDQTEAASEPDQTEAMSDDESIMNKEHSDNG
ncbi:MAG: 50S ribosomal protein L10 [Acidimicrobiales bacterium]